MTETTVKDCSNLALTSSSNEDNQNYIKTLLYQNLPSSDVQNLDKDLRWRFKLETNTTNKKPKCKKSKSKYLTRKQRKELNLLKLPQCGWHRSQLKKMNELWNQYMAKNLNALQAPSREDSSWCSFNSTLGKMEFIGAKLTVVKSKVPSTVGITGIVVLETKSTFQIVNKERILKVLLKKPSVFSFRLNNMLFTVFGKHLIMKPNDRSIKKIKTQTSPDL